MGFNNIAIVYIKRSAYIIYFWYISKDDAIHIMNGSNLVDKRGVLQISFFFFFFFFFFFLLYIKMSECNSIECSSVENTDLTYYKKKRCGVK